MKSILREIPKEQKIALAFSGGLDTRTAVQWMSEKGAIVYCYTADLGQPDEEDINQIPNIAYYYGAKKAKILDIKEELSQEGLIAIRCGAFHIQAGGLKYFNTTPLGRAVTTKSIITEMKKENIQIFADGSTYRGNDIQRFYRYGKLFFPEIKIYKPWLDPQFVKELGGRKEMSEYLEKIGKPYKSSVEKAYSTDSNLLGATHEGKDLENLNTSMKIVTPIMGVPFWDHNFSIPTEEVVIEVQEGIPVKINNKPVFTKYELFSTLNQIAGRHGMGMCDVVENRVIDAKSRGVYEAPGMALLHIVYERLIQLFYNESELDLYYTLGRKLGRLLYEGKWYDLEATTIKETLLKLSSILSGKITIELRRGNDYTILKTESPSSNYDPEALSMERTLGEFTEEDRIGQLEVQNISIKNARNNLLLSNNL